MPMSGPARKPIPPEWSEIGDGPILSWSVGVEKKGDRFKLRFHRTVFDAEEESGKRPIPRVKMNRACRSPAHVTAVEHKETDSLLTSTRPRWNSLRPLS